MTPNRQISMRILLVGDNWYISVFTTKLTSKTKYIKQK